MAQVLLMAMMNRETERDRDRESTQERKSGRKIQGRRETTAHSV